MEIINKNDEALLREYEDFAENSRYGNFMQSLRWPKVKDTWGWDAVISRDKDGRIQGTCLVIIKKDTNIRLYFFFMLLTGLCAIGAIRR